MTRQGTKDLPRTRLCYETCICLMFLAFENEKNISLSTIATQNILTRINKIRKREEPNPNSLKNSKSNENSKKLITSCADSVKLFQL